MRSDAYINVECDKCGHVEHWQPDFVYHDYSGETGYYEASDTAFEKWCSNEGWHTDGDRDVCPDCLNGTP